MTAPVTSVWDGSDRSFLEWAVGFYPVRPVKRILDCTVNAGRFWAGSSLRPLVTGMDVDPRHKPDKVDDNREMRTVAGKTFDVVVYDPPHVPNQGGESTKDFKTRFGTGQKAGGGEYNLFADYGPVMAQCARVLVPDGLVFAKVTDFVHNHRYQWSLPPLLAAVAAAGMTPCDLVVKVRTGPIQDPKWKERHHVRRSHCYWVVARNGPSCERKVTRAATSPKPPFAKRSNRVQ